MPLWAKTALDLRTTAAGIRNAQLFRAITQKAMSATARPRRRST